MFWIINKIKKQCIFVLLAFFFSSLFALDIDLFRLKQKNAFTNETIVFATIIEDVSPNQIDLTVQTLPQNVSFVGSKKEKINFNGLESTAIELHFVFSKSGRYSISSVPIRIRYGYQYVGFETIEVNDNPKNLSPKLIYSVRAKEEHSGDRGLGGGLGETTRKAEIGLQSGDRGFFEQGQRIEILVEAQYFANIQSLSWQASENSIVFNEKILQKLPFYEREFNPRPVELIHFDFIALETGQVFLPSIIVQGKNWAGLDITSINTEESINFLKKTAAKIEQRGTEDLKNNLGTEDSSRARGTEVSKNNLGTEDLESRSSGEFGQSFDEKNILTQDLIKQIAKQKQIIRLISYFCLGLSIFLVLLWFFLMMRKKRRNIFFVLAIFILICYFFTSGFGKQNWQVFDGKVYAIPEENASLLQIIEKPIIVHVLLETNDWARVSYPVLKLKNNSHCAWIKKSELRK